MNDHLTGAKGRFWLTKAFYSGKRIGQFLEDEAAKKRKVEEHAAFVSKALGPQEVSTQIAKRVIAFLAPRDEMVLLQAERSQ